MEYAAKDAQLTRLLLASAIIDQVDAGVADHDEIVAKAIGALAFAKNVSGEKLMVKRRRGPERK